MDLQRQPGQIAQPQVVALRTCLAALTFLRPNKLLKFSVQLLDLPAHGVLVLNVLQDDRSLGTLFFRELSVGKGPTTSQRRGVTFSRRRKSLMRS